MEVSVKRGLSPNGVHIFLVTAKNASALNGKRKDMAAKVICEAAGLCWPEVRDEKRWSIDKSRNYSYHPNTYTIWIRTDRPDAIMGKRVV